MAVIELTAPSEWAQYFMNGENINLSYEEQSAIKKFLKAENLRDIDCIDSEDIGFIRRHDAYRYWPYFADCQKYTFVVPN
jgi:hypothetical protein